MFYKKIIIIFSVILWSGILVYAYDLESDLELESINFAFDSDNPVEDLKQIKRLVAFVNSDDGLLVEIAAHTDTIGEDKYNKRLSMERAEAVKKILVENGILPQRISIKGYASDKPVSSNTEVDGRLLNRRADFSIYKIENGENYYYYKDNKFIRPLDGVLGTASSKDSKRSGTDSKDSGSSASNEELLTRLDDLENLIRDQNTRMAEMSGSRAADTEQDSESAQPHGASMKIIDTPICSISLALGSSDDNYAGRIEARLFLPMENQKAALQAGFDGNIAEHLQEYQVNAGLVSKIDKFQLGCFGSVKFIKLEDYDQTGTLSQINVAASRLFDHGSVGLFATEGIKSEDTIARESWYDLSYNNTIETYLQLRDTYGIHFDYAFNNGFAFYGDMGAVNADDADVFARLKLEYPVFEKYGMNLFVRTDYNSGFLEDDDNYSAFIGVEFNSSSRVFHNTRNIRPMEIQNISYELKTRTSSTALPAQVAIKASAVRGTYPLEVIFSADVVDPDGIISSYEWDFGDGNTAAGMKVTHIFENAGFYNVSLTATDKRGGFLSDFIMIESTEPVNNAPTVKISPSVTSGFRPMAVTFNAIAFDSDGTIVDYSWDFGDGRTASGPTANLIFYDMGVYLVTLTVTDDRGAKAFDGVEISVDNWPIQQIQ